MAYTFVPLGSPASAESSRSAVNQNISFSFDQGAGLGFGLVGPSFRDIELGALSLTKSGEDRRASITFSHVIRDAPTSGFRLYNRHEETENYGWLIGGDTTIPYETSFSGIEQTRPFDTFMGTVSTSKQYFLSWSSDGIPPFPWDYVPPARHGTIVLGRRNWSDAGLQNIGWHFNQEQRSLLHRQGTVETDIYLTDIQVQQNENKIRMIFSGNRDHDQVLDAERRFFRRRVYFRLRTPTKSITWQGTRQHTYGEIPGPVYFDTVPDSYNFIFNSSDHTVLDWDSTSFAITTASHPNLNSTTRLLHGGLFHEKLYFNGQEQKKLYHNNHLIFQS